MKKIAYISLFLLYTCILMAEENDIYIVKMDFFIKTRDFQKAYEKINQIDIEKIPQNKKALFYNKIGFINYKLNKIEEALKNYFLATKMNPDLHFVYNNIGVIYFSQKELNKARKYYTEAYKRKKNYPKVIINLAVVNFYLKDYKTAYEWLKKALSCDTEYVKKRFDRKKALQKLGEWIEQNPEDKDLQKMLEWAKKNRNRDITDLDFVKDYL